MLKYGIELEFFVLNQDDELVPAFEATSNLDGNPIIGELRTKVHDNIIDCVFELKKLICNEEINLAKKGYKLDFYHTYEVDADFIRKVRASSTFGRRKNYETLELLSIYPDGELGKVLPVEIFKASLQVNVSNNNSFGYSTTITKTYKKKGKPAKSTSDGKLFKYSDIFNYPAIIKNLDDAFIDDLEISNRVKGVYAIKDGELGKRIEYRSLPNTVDLDKLIKVLND